MLFALQTEAALWEGGGVNWVPSTSILEKQKIERIEINCEYYSRKEGIGRFFDVKFKFSN